MACGGGLQNDPNINECRRMPPGSERRPVVGRRPLGAAPVTAARPAAPRSSPELTTAPRRTGPCFPTTD
eukprot:5810926-Prymnesium_polylepis.1